MIKLLRRKKLIFYKVDLEKFDQLIKPKVNIKLTFLNFPKIPSNGLLEKI